MIFRRISYWEQMSRFNNNSGTLHRALIGVMTIKLWPITKATWLALVTFTSSDLSAGTKADADRTISTNTTKLFMSTIKRLWRRAERTQSQDNCIPVCTEILHSHLYYTKMAKYATHLQVIYIIRINFQNERLVVILMVMVTC